MSESAQKDLEQKAGLQYLDEARRGIVSKVQGSVNRIENKTSPQTNVIPPFDREPLDFKSIQAHLAQRTAEEDGSAEVEAPGSYSKPSFGSNLLNNITELQIGGETDADEFQRRIAEKKARRDKLLKAA